MTQRCQREKDGRDTKGRKKLGTLKGARRKGCRMEQEGKYTDHMRRPRRSILPPKHESYLPLIDLDPFLQ